MTVKDVNKHLTILPEPEKSAFISDQSEKFKGLSAPVDEHAAQKRSACIHSWRQSPRDFERRN